MCVFHVRFWKVLRLWTTVCCWGSTTRPKQSESASPWAHLQEAAMKRGVQLREPCIQPPWSLSRGAPHAGTHWTTMTRESPFHTVCSYRHITFTADRNVFLSLSVVWAVFQLWVVKESASCCSLESLTSCSPTGRQRNIQGQILKGRIAGSSYHHVFCPISSSNSQKILC